MVSYCISNLCSGTPFRKCRSISRAKKVTCTFLKLLKNLFLWRLGTVLILVWTNYSALIPGPWYASVFDQKELAWRPAQERFKVKCFDLNHSAPIHERRWEGALWYKTFPWAMQSVTCSITMQVQKEMFQGAEGFQHKSPKQPAGSGSAGTPQGLQQNSLALEMLHIFHRNARNRDLSMTKDQDSVVCGLRALGTFVKVFGQGWDADGPFQYSKQFFPVFCYIIPNNH